MRRFLTVVAMRQLPPLAALRAFEAIACRLATAARSCTDHGAISRHLRLLHEHAARRCSRRRACA